MGRVGAGHKGDRNPPPAGLQGWTQSGDPGSREERRPRPLRKRTLSGASGGRAGVWSERWVPPPRPPQLSRVGGDSSHVRPRWRRCCLEREKRKGKPEGVERRLRRGKKKARGLRAHPPLARPAAPLPPRPGDSWARPPRAAAPPPRPCGCRLRGSMPVGHVRGSF